MKFEFSAGGLVYKKDPELRLLFIKATNLKGESLWQLPKGKIEKNEKPEEAALREVEEETGIRAKIVERLHEVGYFYKRDKDLIKKKVYFLLMEYQDGEARPQAGEVDEVAWFTPEEAKKNVGYKNEIEIIDKAVNRIARIV